MFDAVNQLVQTQTKVGYVYDGVVKTTGENPTIYVDGFGEVRFAYRNVRRCANERKSEVNVGARYDVRMQNGRVAGLRLVNGPKVDRQKPNEQCIDELLWRDCQKGEVPVPVLCAQAVLS